MQVCQMKTMLSKQTCVFFVKSEDFVVFLQQKVFEVPINMALSQSLNF